MPFSLNSKSGLPTMCIGEEQNQKALVHYFASTFVGTLLVITGFWLSLQLSGGRVAWFGSLAALNIFCILISLVLRPYGWLVQDALDEGSVSFLECFKSKTTV